MQTGSPGKTVTWLLITLLLVGAITFYGLGDVHCRVSIDRVWIKDHGDGVYKDGWKEKVSVEEGDYVTIHVSLIVSSTWKSHYSTDDKKYCEYGLKIVELDRFPNPNQTVMPYEKTKRTGKICPADVYGCRDEIETDPVYEYTWKVEDIPRYEERDGNWVKVGTQWDSPIADDRLELKIAPVLPGHTTKAHRMGIIKE